MRCQEHGIHVASYWMKDTSKFSTILIILADVSLYILLENQKEKYKLSYDLEKYRYWD